MHHKVCPLTANQRAHTHTNSFNSNTNNYNTISISAILLRLLAFVRAHKFAQPNTWEPKTFSLFLSCSHKQAINKSAARALFLVCLSPISAHTHTHNFFTFNSYFLFAVWVHAKKGLQTQQQNTFLAREKIIIHFLPKSGVVKPYFGVIFSKYHIWL